MRVWLLFLALRAVDNGLKTWGNGQGQARVGSWLLEGRTVTDENRKRPRSAELRKLQREGCTAVR